MSPHPPSAASGIIRSLRSACNPFGLFNALMPKDAAATLAVRDLAYGPHPRQRLDLYLPAPRDASGPLPLLMFLYGGSWCSGCKEHYRFVGHAFAAHGFATAIPDYRLVPEVRFPDFVVDCGKAMRVFRSAAKQQTGHNGPLFLAGHSAGAYNAVMLALDDRIAKAAGYARHIIAGVAGIAGLYDFLPLKAKATQAAFAGIADLAATQPINLAAAKAPPMLLLTGTRDSTVRPVDAERLAEKLIAAGGQAEVRRYDGLGHVGMLVSMARPFRARASVLSDISTRFHAIATGGSPQPAAAMVAAGSAFLKPATGS